MEPGDDAGPDGAARAGLNATAAYEGQDRQVSDHGMLFIVVTDFTNYSWGSSRRRDPRERRGRSSKSLLFLCVQISSHQLFLVLRAHPGPSRRRTLVGLGPWLIGQPQCNGGHRRRPAGRFRRRRRASLSLWGCRCCRRRPDENGGKQQNHSGKSQ